MKNLRYIFIVGILIGTQSAFAAFGSFLNSSSILRSGEYDFSGAAQFYSSDRSGVQVSGVLDLPFTEETNIRFFGGTGSYDFSLGGGLKWLPFQDNDRTPFNLGGVLDAGYARDDGYDAFLFRASPFITKVFTWELGEIEPYLSLPLGLSVVDSDSYSYSQLVIGTKVKFEQLNFMSFSAEGGFKIKNAESYFALMATVHLRR